jgi:hypothetical protein
MYNSETSANVTRRQTATPSTAKTEKDTHMYTIFEIAKFDREKERLQQMQSQLLEEQRMQSDLKRKQQKESMERKITEEESDDDSDDGVASKRNSITQPEPLQIPSTPNRRKSIMVSSSSVLRNRASDIIRSRSSTSSLRKNSISAPAHTEDGLNDKEASFLNTSSKVLKKRYAEIFNGNEESKHVSEKKVTTPAEKKDMNDLEDSLKREAIRERQFEIQCARELKKPPYLSEYEIVNLQRSFLRNFPFHLWKDLNTTQVNSIKTTLSSMKLGKFIQEFAGFCYWTFLKEYAAEPESYDIDTNFLQVYEEIIDIIAKHKQSKLTLTVHLPITLLCIRVTSETIFRICYLNWWNSKYGELMAQKMDNLVSFLFDPQNFFSHLAPLESNVKERRIHQHLTQHQKKMQKTNSMYMLSPVVKYILNDASSLEARNLITKQTYTQKDLDTVMDPSVGDMLKPQVKSKLLNIYMSKFQMNKSQQMKEEETYRRVIPPRVKNNT